MTRYALAPVFLIRSAGVELEVLLDLHTPGIATAARDLLAADDAIDRAGADLIAAAEAMPKAERGSMSKLRAMVRNRRPPAEDQRSQAWLAGYARAIAAYDDALVRLTHALEHESAGQFVTLQQSALRVLPDFAAIESETMLDQLQLLAAGGVARPVRLNTEHRKLARALAMYLQRVCSKNDTISRFGPSAWGRIVDGIEGMKLEPVPGIAARRIEVERWVVEGLIDVMNADARIRREVCPRVHPDAVFEGSTVTRADTKQVAELAREELALLERCDGVTPASRIADLPALARLADAGVLLWTLERFAVDSSPLDSLIEDVDRWEDPELRTHWSSRLIRFRRLSQQFGEASDPVQRRRIIDECRTELAALGVAARDRGRTLYAAANPISENCYREVRAELGTREVARFLVDAAPWFDLFHDAYALGVAKAFDRYHALVAGARRPHARLSYAELVAFARERGQEIDTDQALVRSGAEAFAEIKPAFRALLADRLDAPECALTIADCHFLRRSRDLPPVAEFSYPQADLQIAARSLDELAAGRYRWVLAELHHAFVPLQLGGYWSCPDKPALHAATTATMSGQPYAVRGALAELPVHISGEGVFPAAGRVTFVGRGRPKPHWRSIRRADAEVVVDEDRRDIRLRSPGGGDLGSLIRGFRIAQGMHPFFPLEHEPRAPRLRIGETIVQRASWRVTSADIGERPVGLSPRFLLGVERLRRAGVPRWVFARVPAAALRTFDTLGRDKDLKPFYLDLESAVFLEILERRMRKYGEIILSEMVPAPDELVWTEPTGHHVFELRTLVVPSPAG